MIQNIPECDNVFLLECKTDNEGLDGELPVQDHH